MTDSCAHPRRWFYRGAFTFGRAGDRRTGVRVEERCQECRSVVRADVPHAEVEAAGLPLAWLTPYPGGDHG